MKEKLSHKADSVKKTAYVIQTAAFVLFTTSVFLFLPLMELDFYSFWNIGAVCILGCDTFSYLLFDRVC